MRGGGGGGSSSFAAAEDEKEDDDEGQEEGTDKVNVAEGYTRKLRASRPAERNAGCMIIPDVGWERASKVS